MIARGAFAQLVCAAAGSAFAVSPARAERLIVSVSNHRVTVTPNYSGEELVLFGSVEKDANTPAEPHQLRSRGHRQRSARRHGDAAQGAQIRHLDQHRLPPVPAGADLSRAVFQPAVRRHRLARSAAAPAARPQQCAADPARRPRLCRRGAERCVPQRLRAAALRTRALSRGDLRGDVPDADAVSHRHSAAGRGADRHL